MNWFVSHWPPLRKAERARWTADCKSALQPILARAAAVNTGIDAVEATIQTMVVASTASVTKCVDACAMALVALDVERAKVDMLAHRARAEAARLDELEFELRVGAQQAAHAAYMYARWAPALNTPIMLPCMPDAFYARLFQAHAVPINMPLQLAVRHGEMGKNSLQWNIDAEYVPHAVNQTQLVVRTDTNAIATWMHADDVTLTAKNAANDAEVLVTSRVSGTAGKFDIHFEVSGEAAVLKLRLRVRVDETNGWFCVYTVAKRRPRMEVQLWNQAELVPAANTRPMKSVDGAFMAFPITTAFCSFIGYAEYNAAAFDAACNQRMRIDAALQVHPWYRRVLVTPNNELLFMDEKQLYALTFGPTVQTRVLAIERVTAFALHGTLLLVAGFVATAGKASLHAFRLPGNALLTSFADGVAMDLAISPAGNWLLASMEGSGMRIFDLRDFRCVRQFHLPGTTSAGRGVFIDEARFWVYNCAETDKRPYYPVFSMLYVVGLGGRVLQEARLDISVSNRCVAMLRSGAAYVALFPGTLTGKPKYASLFAD